MFFTAFVVCYLNSKQNVKQYTEILIAKLQNLNPNLSYIGLA